MARADAFAAEWEQPEFAAPAPGTAPESVLGEVREEDFEFADDPLSKSDAVVATDPIGKDDEEPWAEDEFDWDGPAAAVDPRTSEFDGVERTDRGGSLRAADMFEVDALHMGGVAGIETKTPVYLRLSPDGFDLLHEPADEEMIGRLEWESIETLDVPEGRRWRNRSRLVVHTEGGDALFDIPSMTGEQLRLQITPFVLRYGGR
jgi:hypothetical protein